MFDKIGDIAQLVKGAQAISEKMAQFQADFVKKQWVGTAGGSQVSVTMSGNGEIVAIKINPNLMGGDAEIVEDLVKAAVNDARKKLKSELEDMGKNLGLGGLGGLGNLGNLF